MIHWSLQYMVHDGPLTDSWALRLIGTLLGSLESWFLDVIPGTTKTADYITWQCFPSPSAFTHTTSAIVLNTNYNK